MVFSYDWVFIFLILDFFASFCMVVGVSILWQGAGLALVNRWKLNKVSLE